MENKMEKPKGYDQAESQSFEGFKNPVAGGYKLGILNAEMKLSKESQRPMMVLKLDIGDGEFKNYYRELSVKLKKDCFLRVYQIVGGESLSRFKGLITAIEHSNNGFKFNFDENTLNKKFVGAMLGEKQYYNQAGELKSLLEVSFLCSVERALSGTLKIPEPKKPSGRAPITSDTWDDQTNNQPMNDSDLPF